jgi:hypothetical protein
VKQAAGGRRGDASARFFGKLLCHQELDFGEVKGQQHAKTPVEVAPGGSTPKLYQTFRRTLESFFAHSVDQPERAELCRIGCQLLISAEDERPNYVLIASIAGADVAGLRRA